MYTVASRVFCLNTCTTRNHSLRYALQRRKVLLNASSQASPFSTGRNSKTTHIPPSEDHDARTESQNDDEARLTDRDAVAPEEHKQPPEVTNANKSPDASSWHEASNAERHSRAGPSDGEGFSSPAEGKSNTPYSPTFFDILSGNKGIQRFGISDGLSNDLDDVKVHGKFRSNATRAKEVVGQPSKCPDWFLRDNVILAEEGNSHLRAGAIKLFKYSGEEVELAGGHAGLRDLLQQYQKISEEEEHDEDSFDEKIGPFATTSSTTTIVNTDTQVPHAFLSLSHYLEIALSVAAGLTPLKKDSRWDGSSMRTFLALYAPIDGATEFLNQIVQQIATSQNADVIHLNALDLSDLSADIPAWKADQFLSALPSLDYASHKALSEHQRETKDKDEDDQEDEESPHMMTIQMPFPNMAFGMRSRKETKGPGYFMPHERGRIDISTVEALASVLDASLTKRLGQSTLANNQTSVVESHKLVLCISDFAEITSSTIGPAVLQAFERIVQQRRAELGQEIMIVGTSSSFEITNKGLEDVQEDLDHGSQSTYYRTLILAPLQDGRIIDAGTATTVESTASVEEPISTNAADQPHVLESEGIEKSSDPVENEAHPSELEATDIWQKADASRLLNINSRHIKSMIAQLHPGRAAAELPIPLQLGDDVVQYHALDSRILDLTDVHRIAILTAGMQRIKAIPGPVLSEDVKVALSLIDANFLETITPAFDLREDDVESLVLNPPKVTHDLDNIKSKCNKWEKRLIHCIISPDQLQTTFSRVHTKADTVDALRTLTSMTLLRPDSFSYGVLQSEHIPGVLLYGPPGTGKTLLAKAVAKESGATMLAISASEVNHKYVGESEKTVRAIFSLARKLSPCVVFIDEADSLFQSRGAHHPRAGSHETMNQFLSEIEHFGGTSSSEGQDNVFLMIATNRPFDLDDAILRRVPRRLLVDLPTEKDREEILKIHLRDEIVDSGISISDLARRTPFYSGSDLKNLCVAAALACVREENTAAKLARENGDRQYKFPHRRTLTQRHFETAIGEISASVSDDMSSLTQIRKFDEKYGDRKGRREKSMLGFGQTKLTDDMLRVRV